MASTVPTGDARSWSWEARTGLVEPETASGCWGRADSEVLARTRGGGKAGTEAELAGDKRRSCSLRLGDSALEDKQAGDLLLGSILQEISGGSNGKHQGEQEQPRKVRRKVAANRRRLQVQSDDEFQVEQDDVDQGANLLSRQNENLRLQIELKTKELELEENRRLKLELILKTNENESLMKQIEKLKAEIEQLKRAQPPRVRRFCRSCQRYEFHDSRNCPEKPQAGRSSSSEEVSD